MASGEALNRSHTPVTLADQLVAWARFRAGHSTQQIAVTLHRLPSEARAILWGKNER